MNQPLQPSHRVIKIDCAIAHDLTREEFRNHQFQRLVAMGKRFTKCDFSSSEFEAAYLRNCTFDSCDFTGCKFTNSNLRGSRFAGCKFDYAQFSNTHVEPEILDTGCPGHENLQQGFARTLRLNFHQIGDATAANKAIKVELSATRIHLQKAWYSRESYFRKKYSGLHRAKKFVEWLNFVILDFFWGNGESPIRLLRSLVILIFLIALGDVYFLRDGCILSSYSAAILQAPEVLLGITKPADFWGIALAGIASLRYIIIACLVSILIKRLSRR
ncbi:pentapeptide repeat-containing protein [Pelagibius sp.]|uniref:pentapeptide repeat-containing protein n=1 Tax=Pelagibius sp. TaxID=1931238 RepID=UPI00260A751E|nr:pentapeptide repeat-containing protein [Pelagibius sp.]